MIALQIMSHHLSLLLGFLHSANGAIPDTNLLPESYGFAFMEKFLVYTPINVLGENDPFPPRPAEKKMMSKELIILRRREKSAVKSKANVFIY
jgi:hypothetical protein